MRHRKRRGFTAAEKTELWDRWQRGESLRSKRDEIVAGFEVRAAVGRLTARDLALSDEVYDPEIDYLNVRNVWFSLSAPGAGQ